MASALPAASLSSHSGSPARVGALLVALFTLGSCGGSASSGATSGALSSPATATSTQAQSISLAPAVQQAASTGVPMTLTFNAWAPVYAGSGASVTVRYNGATLATVQVNTPTPTNYTVDFTTAPDGGVVDLVFGNASDAGGAVVRSLTVASLTVGSVKMLPTDDLVWFDRGSGAAAFDGLDTLSGRTTLTRNGALRFALPSASVLTSGTLGPPATASTAPGFYVDSGSGNDANPGTPALPWRTLAKAAGATLQAGQGLYLRCGRLWREALALSARQLVDGNVIAGYGPECALRKAVISGADDFSGGWVLNGGIWSRSLPAGTPPITQLFVNGEPMRTAQWPDPAAAGGGWAVTGSGSATNSQLALQSADAATLAGKDLSGATVQVQTQPWFIETNAVVGSAGGLLGLGKALQWTPPAGSRYLLQNKLWMLTSAGEFFHDVKAQRLYLMAPAVGAPADLNAALIEGSVRDEALALSQRNALQVQNIALRGARSDGLHLTNAPTAQISQIEATDNGVYGVRLEQWIPLPSGTPGPTVSNSLVAQNAQYGINALNVYAPTITGNRVLATGTLPSQQAGVTAGIDAGPGASVTNNTVDGSGYHGIYFSTVGGSLLSGNTIAGFCSRLSDCGAIYAWQGRANAAVAQSATVAGNRVLGEGAGAAAASSNGAPIIVGVYLDDFTNHVSVSGNQIFGTPIGIFLHNASHMTVANNHVWLPGAAALFASMDQTDADWMTGNLWQNNEIVPLVQAQASAGSLPTFSVSQAVWFWHSLSGAAALAPGRNQFTGNAYVQLQGSLAQHAWVRGPAGDAYVDAVHWQALNAGDPLPLRPARYNPQILALGPEMVQGGNFAQGLGPWGQYFNPVGTGFAVAALSNLATCTGTCVSLTAGSTGDLLDSPPFTLTPAVPYVYRWTATMPASSGATVAFPYVSRTVSPWDVMADAKGFITYGTRSAAAGETLPYEAFFLPKSAAAARVNLQLETLHVPVAFSAVSVRQVTGYTVAQVADWSALAFAPDHQNRSVGCAELGWPAGCSALDIHGQAVALPLALAAGSQQLLLRADSPYRAALP